ncbi:MAG: hypothetical protein PUB39_06865 [Eubacteriales bacterium]|nr:hypothetical protein [Eubacteriales bacterium]
MKVETYTPRELLDFMSSMRAMYAMVRLVDPAEAGSSSSVKTRE